MTDTRKQWMKDLDALPDDIAAAVNTALGGHTENPTATFTRPADTTAYASGDLIANNVTAGSVVAMQFDVAVADLGGGAIRRARLRKSSVTTTNALFRLHLWKAAPTVANGDNGAFSANESDDYLGSFDILVEQAFSDGAGGAGLPRVGNEINFKLTAGQIVYGLLEARAAYAPANAEVFLLTLEVIQG